MLSKVWNDKFLGMASALSALGMMGTILLSHSETVSSMISAASTPEFAALVASLLAGMKLMLRGSAK